MLETILDWFGMLWGRFVELLGRLLGNLRCAGWYWAGFLAAFWAGWILKGPGERFGTVLVSIFGRYGEQF